MVTKEDERKVLDKIRKIIEPLDEDSYVRAAFRGVFEIAEQNIEFDFGESCEDYIKGKHEAEEKLKNAVKTVTDLTAKMAEQKKIGEEQYAALHERVLNSYDARTIAKLITEKLTALRAEVENAAARIVENAGDPTSAGFNNAVGDHRIAKAEMDKTEELLKRISAIAAK